MAGDAIKGFSKARLTNWNYYGDSHRYSDDSADQRRRSTNSDSVPTGTLEVRFEPAFTCSGSVAPQSTETSLPMILTRRMPRVKQQLTKKVSRCATKMVVLVPSTEKPFQSAARRANDARASQGFSNQ